MLLRTRKKDQVSNYFAAVAGFAGNLRRSFSADARLIEIDILLPPARHPGVRFFLMGLLAFSTAVEMAAASSDYERYGSMAWANARSNERASEYRSQVTANTPSNTGFTQAQIDAVVRAFGTARPSRETNWPARPSYNESESAPRPPEPTEEEKHLASARAGNAAAMHWLGNYYLSQRAKPAVALGWYEAAARAGDGYSMYRAFAMLMDDHSGVKNVARGMEWFKKLADRDDDPEWTARYAQCLWTGENIAQDKALAFQYRLKAASHPKSQSSDWILVAEAYAAGDGVEKNLPQAIEWYRRSAKDPLAVVPLARLLVEQGGGGAKNQAEIENLFSTVALISPATSFYYAYLKDTGKLPPRDLGVALERYTYVRDFDTPFETTGRKSLRQAAARRIMEIHLQSDGVPANRALARAAGLSWLKLGADTLPPVELGYLLIDPALGPPENEWAIKCFDAHPDDWDALRQAAYLTQDTVRMAKLVEHGDSDAARFLADYERYVALRVDPEGKPQGRREQSRAWAAKGAALANLDCLTRQGTWLIEDARVMSKSDATAAMLAAGLACLKKAAERQDAAGMVKLGEVYRDGEGVEKDPAEAFRWFKKSADLGSSPGKYDLAQALYHGAGAPVDKAAALKLAGEVADKIPDAAYLFGLILWRGDGGRSEVAEGIQWMDAALKKDYWPAAQTLAEIYHLGSGVPKDEPRARTYLVKAAEVGGEPAEHMVADAFEKGEIIERDKEEADNRFETWGNGPGGAHKAGVVAAHYLRQGNKRKATMWVLSTRDEADPEIIRVKLALEKDTDATAAAELSAALATLDKNLALLESAAAGFKPTAGRPSFFHYEIHAGTSRRDRDDDYERIDRMPKTPERVLVLGARDATLAGEGDFEAAVIAQQGYYGGDPVRGPRFLAAVQKIATADAERGDVEAMKHLVRLSCPMFPEEYFPFWVQDDREGIRWCRRALLAGNSDALQWLDQFYAYSEAMSKTSPQQRAQWKILREELKKISYDDPDRAALITACARKFPVAE